MTDETIGELHDRLPEDEWVSLPEYGIRVRKFTDPIDLARPDPGASTSARLRLAGRALADVERERDEALTNFHDTYEELVAARREAKDFRAQAELYLQQRDKALHDLARAEFDLRIANAQLAAAVQFSSAFKPGVIVVARQDVGPCVLCGRPIVRSQGVDAVSGSTTKPQWKHAECPTEEVAG